MNDKNIARNSIVPPPDLLEPTLDENDDLRGFENPWNPSSLVLAAFFAGPFAGGYLVASNFKRLGMRNRFYRALCLFVGLGLVIWVSFTTLTYLEWIAREGVGARRLFRWTIQGLTALAAYLVTRSQRARFRLFVASGCDPARLWAPGILAFVVGLGLDFAMTQLVRELLELMGG